MNAKATLPETGDWYEIHIQGPLPRRWQAWFSGFEILPLENGDTLLRGQIPDQPALHGLLEIIRDLNLKLIAVQKK